MVGQLGEHLSVTKVKSNRVKGAKVGVGAVPPPARGGVMPISLMIK